MEKEEMRNIYQQHGLSAEDSAEVVDILLENKELFLKTMMSQELGLQPVEEDTFSAFKSGKDFYIDVKRLRFQSQLASHFFPSLSAGGYLCSPTLLLDIIHSKSNGIILIEIDWHLYLDFFKRDWMFGLSISLFFVTLFLLGVYKGYVINSPWWKSGIIVALNGSVTTVAAYFIGAGLEKFATNI
jgi:hypothetical protein